MGNKLFLFVLILLADVKAQIAFVNPSSNYSFIIPAGWKQSTAKELRDFVAQTDQSYEAVIYPSSKSKYNGPPLILSIFKRKDLAKSEYEPIALDLLKTFKTDLNQYVPLAYVDKIKKFKPGEGYYDKKASSFAYIYESEIKGVGKIYNIITGFFTPKGIIILQYSDMYSNYSKTVDSYIKLVSSLKR